MPSFNILILAAGEGKRMGRVKQLVPYKGKTFIAHTLDSALSLGAAKIYIVLGAHLDLIKPVVSPYPVEVIENRSWSEGMGRSLATGVQHILSAGNKDRGLLVLLIDQPDMMMDEHYLPKLVKRWKAEASQVFATKYGHRFGVPSLFPAGVVARLLECRGDRGAGWLLNGGDLEVEGLEAGNLVHDFDKEGDLRGL